MVQSNQGASNDTRTIVTVLLLIFLFPIGFIVMWVWPKWPSWVKIIISLPIVLFFVGIFAAALFTVINPKAQMQKAACVTECGGNSQDTACVNACIQRSKQSNSSQPTLTPEQR